MSNPSPDGNYYTLYKRLRVVYNLLGKHVPTMKKIRNMGLIQKKFTAGRFRMTTAITRGEYMKRLQLVRELYDQVGRIEDFRKHALPTFDLPSPPPPLPLPLPHPSTSLPQSDPSFQLHPPQPQDSIVPPQPQPLDPSTLFLFPPLGAENMQSSPNSADRSQRPQRRRRSKFVPPYLPGRGPLSSRSRRSRHSSRSPGGRRTLSRSRRGRQASLCSPLPDIACGALQPPQTDASSSRSPRARTRNAGRGSRSRVRGHSRARGNRTPKMQRRGSGIRRQTSRSPSPGIGTVGVFVPVPVGGTKRKRGSDGQGNALKQRAIHTSDIGDGEHPEEAVEAESVAVGNASNDLTHVDVGLGDFLGVGDGLDEENEQIAGDVANPHAEGFISDDVRALVDNRLILKSHKFMLPGDYGNEASRRLVESLKMSVRDERCVRDPYEAHRNVREWMHVGADDEEGEGEGEERGKFVVVRKPVREVKEVQLVELVQESMTTQQIYDKLCSSRKGPPEEVEVNSKADGWHTSVSLLAGEVTMTTKKICTMAQSLVPHVCSATKICSERFSWPDDTAIDFEFCTQDATMDSVEFNGSQFMHRMLNWGRIPNEPIRIVMVGFDLVRYGGRCVGRESRRDRLALLRRLLPETFCVPRMGIVFGLAEVKMFPRECLRRDCEDRRLHDYLNYLKDRRAEGAVIKDPRAGYNVTPRDFKKKDEGEWEFDGLLGICPAEEVTIDSGKCYRSPSDLQSCRSACCIGASPVGGWGLWLEDPDRIVTFHKGNHGDHYKSVARPLFEGENHVQMIVDLDQGHLFFIVNGYNYGLAFSSVRGPVWPAITTHHREETWKILGVY